MKVEMEVEMVRKIGCRNGASISTFVSISISTSMRNVFHEKSIKICDYLKSDLFTIFCTTISSKFPDVRFFKVFTGLKIATESML